MYLKKLSLTGFKNIGHAALEFSAPINCFTGDNGAGKTNVVDAVHYLSMGRSAFTMTDGQCVRHGDEFFLLEGEYSSSEGRKETLVCAFKKGAGKTLKRNGKQYERLSDHFGLIPVVIVSPADSFLVTDAADERRRYLDTFLSQLDKSYLAAIMRYKHVLGERNRLLKDESLLSQGNGLLDVLDMQLVDAGNTVHSARAALIERLAPVVAEYYRELSDDREQVELIYRSELDQAPFEEVLARSRERDFANRFTTSGVHRDDMKMKIGGYPLRKYGSQGQQKSFLIALKLAQYKIVAEDGGEKPILLLDDLFDKLDTGRVEKLISLVSDGGFGQIFITDHSKERLSAILERSGGHYSLFDVEDGEIKPAQ